MAKKKNPDEMSLEELRAEATSRGLEGRSGMSKAELVAALNQPEGVDRGGDLPPSNTTSGGEKTTPPKAGANAETGEGVAIYPPTPTDQSGERTSSVPPSKQLPPDPPDQGADELTQLRAANAALANVVRNLGGNPDEVVKTATAGLVSSKKPGAGVKMRKATVTPEGGSPVEVEYPADTPDDQRDDAARKAWMAQAGVWSPAGTPHVEHGERKKPEKPEE